MVCGNTPLMASVKPFRLSVQAINISSTPLAFRSVNTLIQKEADSVSAIHIPSTSLSPSFFRPITRNALVDIFSIVLDLQYNAIHQDPIINRFQWPALPLFYVLYYSVC